MHNQFEKAAQMEIDNHESETVDSAPNALIEDYLDRVTAPLVGWKDYDERVALRQEIRAHLDAGIAAFQELGESHDEAVRSALKQLGNPDVIGMQYLDVSGGLNSIRRLSRAAGGFICTAFGAGIGMVTLSPIFPSLLMILLRFIMRSACRIRPSLAFSREQN